MLRFKLLKLNHVIEGGHWYKLWGTRIKICDIFVGAWLSSPMILLDPCRGFTSKRTHHFSAHIILVYRQVSNIRRTLVGNKIVDHSDVVGASPVGAAPTTSSFST